MYKFGILGVGKMGGAILDGVVSANIYNKNEIILYTPNELIKNDYLKKGFVFAENEAQLFKKSKIILIAIKPQIFDEVLPIAKAFDFENRFISFLPLE